jgi:hypothetical protein
MNERRTVRASDVIRDIREGMSASELMSKYRFTPKSLRAVFRKMIDFQVTSKSELDDLESLYRSTIQAAIRSTKRKRLSVPLKVYDGGDPFKPGLVKDISERGVCIEGINAKIGDEKSFIIRCGSAASVVSVIFDAKCRWVDLSGKKVLSGYEITNISSLNSKELKKLMHL